MRNNLYSKHLIDKTNKSFLLLAAILVFSTITANAQSNGAMLAPAFLSSSNSFKSNVGLNREAFYNQLAPLILVIPVRSPDSVYSNSIGSKVTTLAEIVYMLGEPDHKIEQSIYEYNLKATLGCKAVIGFNAVGQVTFKATKNCP